MLLKNIFFLFVVLIIPSIALAEAPKDNKLGIGVQWGLVAYGLSVKKEISDTWTLQGTAYISDSYPGYGVRVLYKLRKKPESDLYVYGALDTFPGDSSGHGVGIGTEYNLGNNITYSVEVGYTLRTFEGGGKRYGFLPIFFGFSAHYWF